MKCRDRRNLERALARKAAKVAQSQTALTEVVSDEVVVTVVESKPKSAAKLRKEARLANSAKGNRVRKGAPSIGPRNGMSHGVADLLVCDEAVAVAEGAEIYNPEMVHLGSHAIVSQNAYLCGATHDHNDPSFPLISAPIRIGAYAWICARATVQMGVSVGEGAVLGLGGVATKDLVPWSIYGGIPARRIGERRRSLDENSSAQSRLLQEAAESQTASASNE